ncbi:heat stress transcription factor A-1b-like isoform X2 [Typha latifolia]|uniref:heat stress transcription factor A-1b-like isoform X2 n=1 Tax=Typha latifolia TaxID=4733 RepID=UPI003C3022DB
MGPDKIAGSGLVSMVPPFLTKCYDMVDNPETNSTVSWSASGNSFVIWDPHGFSRDLLPKYFKHNNLSSFVRQLNTYGFRKVDPDRWEFANEGFVRGQKHLLKTITRRKHSHSAVHLEPSQSKNTTVNTCVEVGNFGLGEEIERLKRDKTVLMQELVKLRQHQQSTDLDLQSLRQRLQGMEQNQLQMMSFLAMVVQSPTFLTQLVQQNGNGKWRTDGNKKRRLPALEHGVRGDLETSSEGQIVRYQPSMTEVLNSCTPPVSNADMLADDHPMSNGNNNLSTDAADEASFSLPADDFSWSDYLEQLLASPPPENSEQTGPLSMSISNLLIDDFELPEKEIQMEAP